MTNKELVRTHIAVPHERFGNERVWSVYGGDLALGQNVHVHAMCTAATAIRKAIKQDADEQASLVQRIGVRDAEIVRA